MKFFTMLACLLVPFTIAQAKDLVMITPNTPGSTSDVAARAIAEAYHKNTGHKIVIENVGGGSHVPGVLHWKSRPDHAVLMTTTTILIFNPRLLKDLPYTDQDFNHVTMIAAAPSVWVVRNDSPYRTMQDLVNKLPTSAKPFVAYANHPEIVNKHLIAGKFGWKEDQVQGVKYKGVPEATLGLLEGSIEVGVLALNAGLVEMIRDNRLRVLASTHNKPLTIAGKNVLPASQILDVDQFAGGIFLSLKSNLDPVVASRIKKDLMAAINDPLVAQKLGVQNQSVVNLGPEHMEKFIVSYRSKISNMKFDK